MTGDEISVYPAIRRFFKFSGSFGIMLFMVRPLMQFICSFVRFIDIGNVKLMFVPVVFTDLPGAWQCRSSDNLPCDCKRRSVQKQRRSRSSDGECHFNIHQHPLYYDHGKGVLF